MMHIHMPLPATYHGLTIAEILNRYLSLLRKPLVQIKTNFEYEAFFFNIPKELTI